MKIHDVIKSTMSKNMSISEYRVAVLIQIKLKLHKCNIKHHIKQCVETLFPFKQMILEIF